MANRIRLSILLAAIAFILFTLATFGVRGLQGDFPNPNAYSFGVSFIFVVWALFYLASTIRIRFDNLSEGVFLLVVGTALVAFVLQAGNWGLFVEMLLLTVILVALASTKAVSDFTHNIPRTHRVLFVGFLVLMLFGQFHRNSYDAFPFVPWQMYGNQTGDGNSVDIYRLEGITAEDERIRINPAHLYPSLGYGSLRMANKLLNLEREAFLKKNADALEKYKELVLTIAQAHNRRQPNKIRWIEVIHVEVFLDPPHKEEKSLWKAKVE